MMADCVEIFQASDLANKRVEFLDAARRGRARLRDRDGTSLVMLPERRLEFLEAVAHWSAEQLRLKSLLDRDDMPTLVDLGSLGWLRVFDRQDLREFESELQDALIAATADSDTRVIDETVNAWKVTSAELEDPLRRSVLLGPAFTSNDLLNLSAPSDG